MSSTEPEQPSPGLGFETLVHGLPVAWYMWVPVGSKEAGDQTPSARLSFQSMVPSVALYATIPPDWPSLFAIGTITRPAFTVGAYHAPPLGRGFAQISVPVEASSAYT